MPTSVIAELFRTPRQLDLCLRSMSTFDVDPNRPPTSPSPSRPVGVAVDARKDTGTVAPWWHAMVIGHKLGSRRL
jgi:hypothetical protein